MIESSKHNHDLPNSVYIKVYYTDNYTILKKRFSDMEYAKPFIEILKKNSDFHFIECRIITESKVII